MGRKDTEILRRKLVALGPEQLADVLLKVSVGNEEIQNVVERLLSTDEENLQRFKHRLSALKRSDEFYSWRQTSMFEHKLESILQDVDMDNPDSKSSLEALALFYESDGEIFKKCDDSGGSIGMIFTCSAAKLFRHHASRCEDKDWISDLILKINTENGYGVRSCLFERLFEYMSESDVRSLAAKVENLAQKAKRELDKYDRWSALKKIAFQLQDPDLYERAHQLGFGKPDDSSLMDLARIYKSIGEYDKALSIIESIDGSSIYLRDGKEMRLELYRKLGRTEMVHQILLEEFRNRRSVEGLSRLFAFIPKEDRDIFLKEEVETILNSKSFSPANLAFLVETEHYLDAEEYLIKLRSQVGGLGFFELLPVARKLEDNNRFVGATIVYRALIDYTLQRARTKEYGKAVDHFRRLDLLSKKVRNWREICDHKEYRTLLKEDHGRKSSFWRKLK